MDDRKLYQVIARAGGRLLEVGGCVRDSLRGVEPKDRDFLVCGLEPDHIIELLKPHGRVDVVGQSFGVIKFTPRGEQRQIDLSLPRREVSTGVGHRDFHIDADPYLPVEVDLERRDFTINAIARDCRDGALIDPFHGAEDLAARRLRMVGPRAFEEDPLRVLRGAQFAARLGLTVEPATLAAMRAAAPLLPSVSPERISGELVKGLKAERPGAMFRMLEDHGLLVRVIPELSRLAGLRQDPARHDHDALTHALLACDLIRCDETDRVPLRLAAVFHDLGKAVVPAAGPEGPLSYPGHAAAGARICEEVLERLRFTSTGEDVDVTRITHLVRAHEFSCPADADTRQLRHLASQLGPKAIGDVLRLRIADRLAARGDGARIWEAFLGRVQALLAEAPPLTTRDLAVNGRDLIASGVPPGPGMGRLLQVLLDAVLDEPARNTRDTLLALARERS